MVVCELLKLYPQTFAISELLKTTLELDTICSTEKTRPNEKNDRLRHAV